MAGQMTDQVTERVRGQVDELVAAQVAAQMEQQVKNATDNIYKALGDQNGETIVYSAYRAEKAKNATGAEKAKTAEDGTNLSEKLNLVGDGYKLLNYFDSNTAIGTVVPGIVSFLVRRSGVTAASVIVDLNGDQRVTSPMLNVCIPESTTFPGATPGAVVQYALFFEKASVAEGSGTRTIYKVTLRHYTPTTDTWSDPLTFGDPNLDIHRKYLGKYTN